MSKKLIAIALAGLFVFSAVSVKATTIEELQVQIAALLAQITALQSQIAGQTTTGTVCFNTDLSQGMTSDNVKNLQIKLGVTPTSGYFGPITLAAVKVFQTANGIVNTGYVGPLTRASLNTLYCTPVVSYPAGCTSAVGFSSTTGLSCAGTVVSYPAGCTSAVGFSSTTGLSCAGTTTTTVVAATEGTLTVTQYAIPGSATVTLYGGNTNKEVAAYKIKATNSDVRIKRILLQFVLAGDFPWRDLSSLSLWDGSTLLKEVPATQANFAEVAFSTTYTMQFDGFDVLVAKDTEKVLSVKATAVSVPQYAKLGFPGLFTLTIPANGVRGVDTASLNVYGPGVALPGHIFATALPQAPAITTTASIDSPVAGNFIGSATAVTRVSLMKINVKVEAVDMTFKGGGIRVDTNVATTLSALELYDGSTLLASAPNPGVGNTAPWSTFTLPVSADTTKVLTVKGVIRAAPIAGSGVGISLLAGGLTGIDANGSVQVNAGAITGYTLTVYTAAPTFALASASVIKSNSSTTTTNNVGDFTIGISISANSGDIYIPTVSHASYGSLAGLGLAKGILESVSAPGGTPTATSSNWSCDANAVEDNTVSKVWKIPSGATSVCTYNYHVLNTTTAAWYTVSVLNIKWATNADMVTGGLIIQADGLSALKAPATLLNL